MFDSSGKAINNDDPKAFPGVNNAKLGGREDVTKRTDTIVIYTTGGVGTKQVIKALSWRCSP